jgi:RNA polymerase sigma factor (sigma-70 family)
MKEVTFTPAAMLITDQVVDQDTFLAHYDLLFPRIYTYFRCRCDDPSVCDELTSQAFEQSLANLHQYDSTRGPFAAWLFGIARNIANGHLRRTFRFRWLPLELFNWMPSPDISPEEAVVNADQHQALLISIRSLSARQRDLLALKFFSGLTNRQIAALTGLSEANVAAIVHRSIRQLRRTIISEEQQ